MVWHRAGHAVIGMVSKTLISSLVSYLLHLIVQSSHYLYILNPFSPSQQSFSEQQFAKSGKITVPCQFT